MSKEKKKSWLKRHKILTGIIGFIFIIILIQNFKGTGEPIKEKISLPSSYEEAKQNAINVSYEDLMRYSENYEEEWICLKGEIIQVVSDIPDIELRVATKKDSWIGYLDDVVYLYSKDYQKERLLEGDIIEFCGISKGFLTYESTSNLQVTIPEIKIYDKLVNRIN